MKHFTIFENKEHRLTLLALAFGVIATVISILDLINSKRNIGYLTLFTFVIILLIYYLINIYYLKRFKFFTKLPTLKLNKIRNNINPDYVNEIDKACLNRYKKTYSDGDRYWPSSWLGCSSNDLIDNVIIEDYNENRDLRGKIPVKDVTRENKVQDGLRIKFNHKKGGWWTAILHGKFGKPSEKMWSRNSFNICNTKFLSLYGKSKYSTLNIYIRFEDISKNSSNGVIIKIDTDWKKYEIPTSKFLTNRDLYKDENFYLSDLINNNESYFDFTEVQQIDFGCSEKMDSQNGEIYLCDIKLI